MNDVNNSEAQDALLASTNHCCRLLFHQLLLLQMYSDKQRLTDDDNLTRKERAKKAYREWAQVTTWHGIPDAFRSTTICPKVFWTVILLAATVMLIYQLYNVIDDYANNSPYSTAVSAVQVDSGAPWPNVTICNYNRANSSKLNQLGMSVEAVSYLYGTLPQYYMTSAFSLNDNGVTANLTNSYNQFLQTYSPTPNIYDVFNYIGHDCEASLIGCYWTGVKFNCCANSKTILNVYGKCHSITPPSAQPWNAGNPPSQSVAGPGNGLTLLLDPSLSSYSSAYYNDYLAEGILILINWEPMELWPTDQLVLTAGEVASMSLSLSYSYTNTPKVKIFKPSCRVTASYQYLTGNYTITSCIMDCFIQAVASLCKCLFTMGSGGRSMSNPSGIRTCVADDHICYVKLLYGTENIDYGNAYNQFSSCSKNCDPPCMATYLVKAAMTTTTSSQQTTRKKLKRLVPIVNDTAQLIQLDIYYPFMGYIEYSTSERVSLFDFICNIGGQLGLWAGMSIISIAQMCYFCSTVVSCGSCRCPRRHKTSP